MARGKRSPSGSSPTTKCSKPTAKQESQLESLAVQLRDVHAEIIGLGRITVEKAIAAGKIILQARPLITHGDYIEWATRFVGSDDTARNYAAVAEVDGWPETKSRTIRNSSSLTEAYRFAHNEIAKRKAEKKVSNRQEEKKLPRRRSLRKKLKPIPVPPAPKDQSPSYEANRTKTPTQAVRGVGSCPIIQIKNVQPTPQSTFSALQAGALATGLRSVVQESDKHLLILVTLDKKGA